MQPKGKLMTMRALRVNDDIWRKAQLKAKEEGVTLSEVIRTALKNYIREEK